MYSNNEILVTNYLILGGKHYSTWIICNNGNIKYVDGGCCLVLSNLGWYGTPHMEGFNSQYLNCLLPNIVSSKNIIQNLQLCIIFKIVLLLNQNFIFFHQSFFMNHEIMYITFFDELAPHTSIIKLVLGNHHKVWQIIISKYWLAKACDYTCATKNSLCFNLKPRNFKHLAC